ncbi:MAG: hypothetical protein ACFFDQ_01900 [Candidatus Thorarchaeota archaeon]
MGPALVSLGIFGGGFFWLVLTGLRFDYLITNVYHGDPGEAIWSLDPLFTVIAAVPGLILVFVGIILSAQTASEQANEIEPEVGYHQLNLFYIGEISLLVTAIVSFIGFLGISQSIVEIDWVAAIIMGAIVITSIVQLLSFVLRKSISKIDSFKLSKNAAILLAVELGILLSIVLILRLYTWSFIRWTTLVIISSGFLGLLFLTPSFLDPKCKSGAEGEI